ncbi:sodium:proton antiporter [Candidatus Synechococcus calcipolaris G9]|uniref:Sodium:proton antiporter n=1 Tax=Candidatus Synechococcus calcipolaris G9 TaxID=1497997 RepID=A0ABT6EVK8_9SYNE|nr:sodium:proton antiporter [Candidatus Synechococcus calcipolaris]MDG2989832.1 sodium:proton antiporter [Candidatus Synechococcus calcipolaris G9]
MPFVELLVLLADVNTTRLDPLHELLAPQSHVTALVNTLIVLLLVATVVALVSRRLRTPYVIGLVLAGLVIPQESLPENIGLNPEIILNLFLPILIFEAAINTDLSRLRSTIKPIFLLAGPGVVLSAAITATLLQFGLGLAWITACAIGVILTITDTVSVIVTFRNVPVPPRLASIVEGESLFNDGTALVLLSVITGIHVSGTFSLGQGIAEIFIAFVGGGILGSGLGYLCVGLFQELDDALSNILLTVAVSLGTFQVGQVLGVSGAIAVVTAGLVIGGLGFRQTSASTRVTLLNFWEYAGFGVNTFIFLLVGIEVKPGILWMTIPAALLAIAAYQVGRICAIYPLLYGLGFYDHPLPLKWQHVLIFGNVKGSLSMALALSLPATLPDRSQVITLVFSTVLVSLVVQGLSLPSLVKRLNLSRISPIQKQIESLQLNLIAAKAAQNELGILLASGSLPKFLYEELFASYQSRVASSEKDLREMYNQRIISGNEEGDEAKYLKGVYRRLYVAEKGAINDAIRKGILSEDIGRDYINSLNEKLLVIKDDN